MLIEKCPDFKSLTLSLCLGSIFETIYFILLFANICKLTEKLFSGLGSLYAR